MRRRHQLSRKLTSRRTIRPSLLERAGNDFRDAAAIAEAVQRPTMMFVATKSAEQLDLQALQRVRERLIIQRFGIVVQIRGFLLGRGVAVRQSLRFLRARYHAFSPLSYRRAWCGRSKELAGDWRRLDERIEGLSSEIEVLARRDVAASPNAQAGASLKV